MSARDALAKLRHRRRQPPARYSATRPDDLAAGPAVWPRDCFDPAQLPEEPRLPAAARPLGGWIAVALFVVIVFGGGIGIWLGWLS